MRTKRVERSKASTVVLVATGGEGLCFCQYPEMRHEFKKRAFVWCFLMRVLLSFRPGNLLGRGWWYNFRSPFVLILPPAL
eukprot:6277917-Amphidinium_carterae.1